MPFRLLIALITAIFLLSGCGRDSSGSPSEDSKAPSSTNTTIGIAEALPCPKYLAPTNAGTIKDADLDELSGLAKSIRNSGIFWTHNDSGDDARIFAITSSGIKVGTIELRDTNSLDMEDIAVAPGTESEVWAADIGDNLRFRSNVQLYHFTEPEIPASGNTDAIVNVKRVNVKFQNPNGDGTISLDSESFFIDRLGNGYLVEKTNNTKNAWVFQIAAQDLQQSSATAKPIVQITGNSSGSGVGPTAADISADGTTLAIKNYSETFVWRFTPGSSVTAVLKAQPTAPCTVKAGLGEAITFDGKDLLTVEEGVGKPLRRTKQSSS